MNRPEHWIGAGRTEIGRVRPTNQDAFAALNERMVWLVADGMGGHPAGDLAAHMAVASVVQDAERCFHPACGMTDDPSRLLSEWLIAANRSIYEHAQAQPGLTGMGTTIVAMTITTAPAPAAHIAHLGDSRAYRYRAGTLRQLTRDHTLIENYLRSGLINEAQSKTHPERHVLTEALGIERHVTPTTTTVRIEPEDRFLLCTDGLTKMLDDREIAACLSDAEADPSRICDALIDQALDRGGQDNVTVIVCISMRSVSRRPSNH
ncbi:MAG: Stp1/IreP family PP2C-type Ser/Thr phosphatase [Nitrospira sp.]|nr:Stp1/IreP family PP2C-type Ser/Thr phosphatase [Nitrospira sp.]